MPETPTSSAREKVFKGIAASPGVAHGPVFIHLKQDLDVPRREVPPEAREDEIARFEQGLMETRRQIGAIRAEIEEKLGEDEAAIFDAHLLVLEDRALIEDTVREVAESGYNIEYCLQRVAERYIEAFSHIDDAYIKERVSDIRDVTQRLLKNLLGRKDPDLSKMSEDSILAARDITPSDAANLGSNRVRGIITDLGSRTSHTVIMARSLNVPCVVGLHDLSSELRPGDKVLVDGFDGIVIVNPSESSLFRYGEIKSARQAIEKRFKAAKDLPAVTRDERSLSILLNIEGNEPASVFEKSGADGVGLFRTEWLFLRVAGYPSEEEQFEAYKSVVERFNPRPVTIRTLDLGGDKNPHGSMADYREANPFMGFRAIRFCLEHPEVFKKQLRAILRASALGKVKILYPMISSCEEVVAANELLEECKEELKQEGRAYDEGIRRGAMIEIPSAAVITDLLAEHSDFFSIGTNDLIQYLLAVDRVNDRIAHLYEPNHPAVMRALNFIFEAGREREIPVSVCGEMAGDPLYAGLLFGLGASELSLTWNVLPEIKYLVRRMKLADAEELARQVVAAREPKIIERLLRDFQEGVMGVDFPHFQQP